MKRLLLILLVCSTSAWSQIALPIQQSVLPKNSLVVNYDFSKSASYTRGSTTVSNISASGNANLLGTPNFMNSLGFVSFNGTSQYLMTPNLRPLFRSVNAGVQKSFTMSLWFFPKASNGVIVSEHESQTINSGWFTSNIELVAGRINFKVWNNPAIQSSTITINNWYHVAMVYDGASVKAYLNGVLQGIQALDRVIPPLGQNYGVGAPSTTNMGSGLHGNFDLAQFKLHHLPLTDSDILQEYNLRKDELDYTIHSPITNVNPTYWNVSSAWHPSDIQTGASGTFGTYAYVPWLNSSLGWVAQQNSTPQFISLSYDEPVLIKGIVTQGRKSDYIQWVSQAHIETSMTGGEPWTRVLPSKSLNVNMTEDVYTPFTTPVFAKAVRVIPTSWNMHVTMRMGMLVKPNNPITDGLVLNLDAANIKSYQVAGTTWTDLSSSSNHATISLSPTHNAATGLTFNGSNQYGRIPSVNGVTNFTNTQQYSIEVWFNPASGQANSGEAELLEKWNLNNEPRYPFTIRFNETQKSMLVGCFDGSKLTSVTASGFSVNTWVQLVAVFNFVARTLTVYRNGVSVGSTSLVGVNQVSNTSPVGIAGRIPVSPATGVLVPFKGSIGIIRLYNKALTNAEILQNYDDKKIRFSLVQDGLMTNLMNPPSSGTTWADASGNGNNATINGSPTYTSANGGGYTTSTSSYISIPYNLPNTFTVSVACALNPTTFWATLWGNESWSASKGFMAYLGSSTIMNFGSPSGLAAITVSGINTVHIWDFVANGTNYTLYRDGVSVSTGTFTAPSGGLSTTGLYFGARHNNAGTSFADACPGTYYSMRVYNRALNADEIQTNFSALRSNYGL